MGARRQASKDRKAKAAVVYHSSEGPNHTLTPNKGKTMDAIDSLSIQIIHNVNTNGRNGSDIAGFPYFLIVMLDKNVL